MTSWIDFAAAQPELAGRVRQCFAIHKHATVATLRRDGSPRISGTEADFAEDGLYPGDEARRTQGAGLTPRPTPGAALPDRGSDRTRRDEAHRFAIAIVEVVHTAVGTPADHLMIESWHADVGLQRRERR